MSTQIIARFPLAELLYILVTGIFTIIFIPFDIFSHDFSTGLNLTTIEFYNLNEKHSLFVNLQQLNGNSFSEGFTIILILGLFIGIVFFIIMKHLQEINHIPKRIYAKIKNNEKNTRENKRKRNLPFEKWLGNTGLSKYLSFIYSIHLLSTGVLHASEFGFLINLLFVIFTPVTWVEGLLPMIIITIFSYALHFISRKSLNSTKEDFLDRYNNRVKYYFE